MASRKRGKRAARKLPNKKRLPVADDLQDGESQETELAPKLPATPAKGDFLTEFGLLEEDFAKIGVSWEDLRAVSENHLREYLELQTTAEYIATRLRRHPSVHSVIARVKDPANLMEKILRKVREEPRRKIGPLNYTEEVTDLIGIRVLHLFKGDWLPIHRFITTSWELAEPPIAYLRRGDPAEVEDIFRRHGCDIQEHKMGYRSVHYLINSQPAKTVRVAELQVRTIFEEGWSEIDHRVRYPYKVDNEVLNQFLGVFNHLAGSADEMGTFIQRLRDQQDAWDSARLSDRAANAQAVESLSAQIAKLKIDASKKRELEDRIKDLESRLPKATIAGISPNYFGVLGSGAIIGTSAVISSKPSMKAALEGVLSQHKISITQRKCSTCGADISWSAFGNPPYCATCMGSAP